MIALGIILIVVGFITHIPLLVGLGILAFVVGLILELLGATGRAFRGRRHYY